ncbi:MAG: methyltransferase domain-containing protein [Acidisphaera sp.]|nr:methyltransferase domain-containing protein [Acidisphaera sp.]
MGAAAAVGGVPARRLRDRLLDGRDRLQASPAFRRWATAFPLTRPVARRRARALFDLCAGFAYSQILLACVQVGLFELLADGPLEAAAIARRTELPVEGARRLLAAAASLDLLARRGEDRYGLGNLGAALLGNPGLVAMIEHHTMLYADLRDPVGLLRREQVGTSLGRYWGYAESSPGALTAPEVSPYSRLMAASQPLIAAEVLAAYRFGRHGHLLDVGGGTGAFLLQVAEHAPGLKLTLFDLPAVAEVARARFAAAGLGDRAQAVGGDFHSDRLPQGADAISLVRVLHDHDDASALALLRSARTALSDDGTLVIAEPMSGTAGAAPIGDAYFGFYLLAMGRGRPRTPAELGAMLRQAGFAEHRLLRTRTPLLARVILARGHTRGVTSD